LVINRLLGVLIASIASTVFETVPHLRATFGPVFEVVEMLCLAVFSVEYCLRVWTAPEHVPYRHRSSYAARRTFVLSSQGIVDCVAWTLSRNAVSIRMMAARRAMSVTINCSSHDV